MSGDYTVGQVSFTPCTTTAPCAIVVDGVRDQLKAAHEEIAALKRERDMASDRFEFYPADRG